MLACGYGEGPEDDCQCGATEDEVGPLGEIVSNRTFQVPGATCLVIGHHESTDQPGDDHDLVDEESEQNRRPWQSGGQQ